MVAKIEAGGCYEIIDFRTGKIREQYKVVLHETQVLFNSVTKLKKLASVFPPIPRHRFFLQDYNTLYPRLDRVDILTGKIVLNSTGSSLFFIDPDILEVNSYKSVFSNCKEFPKILPPSSDQTNEAKLLQTAKKVTIDELAFLDPDLYKDETFLCKAAVKHFDTRYDWWYSACPICVKQMHKDPTTTQLICQKHPNQIPTPCLESINFSLRQWYKVNLILEDETNEIDALIIGKCGEKLFGMRCKDLVMNQTLVDHQQLPNEFLRLIGQKKIFHMRFGNRRNNFNPSNVLIQNVTDDTTMQPATPLPLPREITGSSTTVSSSTSSAETTEQSNKRKRESIKRTLFTNNEQRKMEEVSEADPREFDEVPIKLLKKKSSPTSGKLGTTPEKTN
ncbi:uncharacterized protein LOC103931142 isoform X2 [Pyrus x bretschneideri]|uniref:uncharacterized protein LOC103931142 isoform X2 n=1 Tax=Pyrus x bretschneideri TaxID=225117 RepID=UPI00202E23C9|nr:uncharacterized protein LOC103931142 isoform X2 [Pyrus x bretschneideri]